MNFTCAPFSSLKGLSGSWKITLAASLLCFLPKTALTQKASLEEYLQSTLVEKNGEQVAQIPLEKVVHIALEFGSLLRSEELNVLASRKNVLAARERNRPFLSTQLGHSNTHIFQQMLDSGGMRLRENSAETFSLHFTDPTENGSSWSLALSHQNVSSQGHLLEDDYSQLSTDGGKSSYSQSSLETAYSLPLSQGRGKKINALPLKLSQVELQESQRSKQENTRRLIREVGYTYWDILDAQEQLKVQTQSLQLIQALSKENKARVKAGLLPETDLLVTDSQIIQAQQSLLRSQQRLEERKEYVLYLLGAKELPFAYELLTRPVYKELPKSRDALKEQMLQTHPSLKKLKLDLKSLGYQIDSAVDQTKSDLSFNIYYHLKSYGNSQGKSLGNLPKNEVQDYGATLVWNSPLYSKKNALELTKLRLQKTRLEVLLRQQEDLLTTQFHNALRNLELATKSLELASAEVGVSQKIMENETELLRVGKSTTFKVSTTQQDHTNSRYREIASKIGFEKSYLEVLLLSGEIFSYFHLPPAK